MMAADVIMPHSVRERKLRSVSASLRACSTFSSDQRGVWQDVAALHRQSQSPSTTFAASDIFRARAAQLEDALAAIPLIPHQTGLMVMVGDTVIGFDLLSSPRAYARLHSKLVKSYLLEAILLRSAETVDPAGVKEKAMSFLAAAGTCDAQEFPSAGCGNDWRFTGPNIVGLSLIHDDCPVHALFSRASHADRQPPSSHRSTGFSLFAWFHRRLKSR